jgi:hypothetical protein
MLPKRALLFGGIWVPKVSSSLQAFFQESGKKEEM